MGGCYPETRSYGILGFCSDICLIIIRKSMISRTIHTETSAEADFGVNDLGSPITLVELAGSTLVEMMYMLGFLLLSPVIGARSFQVSVYVVEVLLSIQTYP